MHLYLTSTHTESGLVRNNPMGLATYTTTKGAARPAFPPLYDVLPHVMIAAVLAVRPPASVFTRISACVAVAAVVIAGAHCDTGNGFVNYITAIAMGNGCLLGKLLLLVLYPTTRYRHESQRPNEEVADMPYWKRFYWAMCLTYSSRGVGWNYQIQHLPPIPKHRTRAGFVASRALRVVWNAFIMDVCYTYMDFESVFASGGAEARHLQVSQPWRFVLDCAVFIMTCYCRLNVAYDGFAAAAVALGLSEARHWPVTFGSWRDAYTVRRFWGRVWHQHMRRYASGISKFVARTLYLSPGSWLSSHVQLFVAFSLTGLSHVLGDYMVQPALMGISFPFFIAQATAITVEDAIISLGTSSGIPDSPLTRFLGYTWTIAWLLYSNTWFSGWQIVAGLGRHRMFAFSLVRPALAYLAVKTRSDVET